MEVVCPVPEDEDAIFWNPDADMLAEYQAADLIVVDGNPLEDLSLLTNQGAHMPLIIQGGEVKKE